MAGNKSDNHKNAVNIKTCEYEYEYGYEYECENEYEYECEYICRRKSCGGSNNKIARFMGV